MRAEVYTKFGTHIIDWHVTYDNVEDDCIAGLYYDIYVDGEQLDGGQIDFDREEVLNSVQLQIETIMDFHYGCVYEFNFKEVQDDEF